MKKYPKRDRQEGAIKRLEKTVALHEANAEFTKQIIEDHKGTIKIEKNLEIAGTIVTVMLNI